jgi:hypothetical protein
MHDGEELGTESVRGEAGDATEVAGEVALVGESKEQADFGEREITVEQITAGFANTETARVFADAFALESAKHTGKVHGVDAGCGAEIVEGEARTVFGADLINHAGEPSGRTLVFFERELRGKANQFGKDAFDTERIGLCCGECFTKEIHTEPEKRASARVFAATFEIAGTFGKAPLPSWTEFDVKETQAPGPDFILMGNAGGAEHDRHGRELFALVAVAFAIETAEEKAEEREFVRVHRELAGDGVVQISENGAAVYHAMAHSAEELASLKTFFASRDGLRFRHRRLQWPSRPARTLLLF